MQYITESICLIGKSCNEALALIGHTIHGHRRGIRHLQINRFPMIILLAASEMDPEILRTFCCIDQSKLGDTAFDNLMILWYNEEEGIFEEMPTDRDISLEIERNRKYLDKIKVRPPSADEKAKINTAKTKYNADAKRNAAYAYGSIDGQKIDFECISGVNGGANFKKVNSTDYHFSGLPSYDYVYHTEQDIIEYVYSVYKNNTTVSGTITVVSERNFCMNCWEIISQFQAEFPNIDIVRVFVK